MNDCEIATIGGLLLDNDAWWQITGRVAESDFESADHRTLFRTITGLIEKDRTADAVTIGQHVNQDLHRLAMQMANEAAGTANIRAYADGVCADAQTRAARRAMHQAICDLDRKQPVDEVLTRLSESVEHISMARMGTDYSFKYVIQAGLETAEMAHEQRLKGRYPGVLTGIPAIDHRTGGLHPGQLVLLAARPGSGKTAFINQIALHTACRSHAVGILNLEMGVDELGIRSLAHKLKINGTALRKGEDAEFEQLLASLPEAHLSDLPIRTDTDTFTLDGIVARLTEWRRKYAIRLGVVDYLQLVEADGYNNRNDQVGAVSRRLKKAAKRLEIPLLVASQLNRSSQKENRRPMLSDLRDSGNLEQDADCVIILHAPNNSCAGKTTDIEIGLLKNRVGRSGWLDESRFEFDGPTQTFKELARPGSYPAEYAATAASASADFAP